MSLEKVLAQQETAISDARIAQLSECRYLSEQEVIELAAKCKVWKLMCTQRDCAPLSVTIGTSCRTA
jgi:hypothetical protein